MPIPQRIREEAAMLCAIAASYDGVSHRPLSYVLEDLNGADSYTRAAGLALSAWALVFEERVPRGRGAFDVKYAPEIYAEAESLLRTGWSPDDGGTP